MTSPQVVPGPVGVRVTITAPLIHLCPYADEIDSGTVEIGWTTGGVTLELHALAAHLRSYADQRISHENLANDLAETLHLPGIEDVHVAARFTTAGLGVEVSSAVPRDPVHAAGA